MAISYVHHRCTQLLHGVFKLVLILMFLKLHISMIYKESDDNFDEQYKVPKPSTSSLSDYELVRLKNIEENNKKIKELGLAKLVRIEIVVLIVSCFIMMSR